MSVSSKAIVVCILSIGSLFVVRADAEADGTVNIEIRALRAEVKMLQATVKSQSEQINKLKAENAKIRKQLAAAKAAATSRPAATQPNKPNRSTTQPKKRQYKLNAIHPITARKAKELVGHRIYGPTRVTDVKPDPNRIGQYIVTVADMSEGILGVGRQKSGVEGGYIKYVYVTCILRAPESTALRLSKGDDLNIAGDIERIEIIPKTKGFLEKVRIYLCKVRAR